MDWLYFFAVDKSISKMAVSTRAVVPVSGRTAGGAPRGAAGARAAARSGIFGVVLGLAACLSLAPAALAEEKLDGAVVIEEGGRPYTDLRRALLRISNMPSEEQQRRRLSADERSTLRREWRETMRGGVYERKNAAGSAQRRPATGPK